MVDCAKGNPFALVVLMDIRYAEVVFLLHQAKEEGSAEMFYIALKFSAPLFNGTHATKHMELLAKFFKWWDLKSKGNFLVFEKFALFKNTSGGKTI